MSLSLGYYRRLLMIGLHTYYWYFTSFQFPDMSDVYHPPERVAGESHCRGMQKYQEMYQESIDDPTRLE